MGSGAFRIFLYVCVCVWGGSMEDRQIDWGWGGRGGGGGGS